MCECVSVMVAVVWVGPAICECVSMMVAVVWVCLYGGGSDVGGSSNV